MIERYYKWELEEDYSFKVPFNMGLEHSYSDNVGNVWLSADGNSCTIHKGYAWDGCSPKFKVFGKVVGTWDGRVINHKNGDTDQELKYASLVHDVFCQFAGNLPQSVSQSRVDDLFYRHCRDVGFKWARLYYKSVRSYMKKIVKRY